MYTAGTCPQFLFTFTSSRDSYAFLKAPEHPYAAHNGHVMMAERLRGPARNASQIERIRAALKTVQNAWFETVTNSNFHLVGALDTLRTNNRAALDALLLETAAGSI
jgi:hypothetical protein